MGRNKEPILTYEMTKIPTETEYPCQTCNQLEGDGECRQGKCCARWQGWFYEAWGIIRISFKRN